MDKAEKRAQKIAEAEARQAEKAERRLRKIAELEARRDQIQADKAAAKEARKAAEAELSAKIGPVVAQELFTSKMVTIYQNGFVKVRGILGGSPEKLLSISATSDITKKSGLGRGVAAIATGGLNLLSPNKRGDVYLVIVTDQTTHTLHTDMPTANDLKNAKKLEAAGLAVLARQAGAETTSDGAPAVVQQSAPEQLREMKSLLDEGVITQEEFDKFKAGLLG